MNPITQEVLVPEVIRPDITEEIKELVRIQTYPLAVIDKASNDMTAEAVFAAESLIKAVNTKFDPVIAPIKAGLAALNSILDEVRKPCLFTVTEGRKACAKWQSAEQMRLESERTAKLKAYQKKVDEATPFDEPIQVPDLAPVQVESGGFALRNKPWDIEEVDRKELEAATLKDPRLWAYWTPDIPALKAAAKSQKEKFNIPGFKAVRGKTVTKKG